MRARAVLLPLLLASCFPDADKLRGGGASPTTGGIPVAGSGGVAGIGGAGGTAGIGGTAGAGTGGTAGTGGASGMGGVSGIGGAAGMGGGSGMGGTGGAPSDPTRAQRCMEFAAAASAKTFQCAPFLSALRYGTQEAYAARLRLNCGFFDLPGVTFPAMPFKPCADALAAQSCEAWFDDVAIPACAAPGLRPIGGVCAAGLQCASSLCELNAAGCGRCIAYPKAGEACQGNCDTGLACNAAMVCVARGDVGAACGPNAPCKTALGCHKGVCVRPGPAGTPCESDDACDFFHGSVCNETMKVCVSVTIGPMCGAGPAGGFVACGASATCKMDGSCLPAAADGAACNNMGGPACTWPAQCANDLRCRIFIPNRACPGGTAAGPEGRLDPRRSFAPAERELDFRGGVEPLRSSLGPSLLR
jgi:hypothetical protein